MLFEAQRHRRDTSLSRIKLQFESSNLSSERTQTHKVLGFGLRRTQWQMCGSKAVRGSRTR